jgi:putative FmdB family regulatory protein
VPIYEYQCSKCSHRFETIHGASEKDLKIICPKCGDPRPERVISLFSCGGSQSTDSGSVSACGPKPGRFS